MNGDAVVNKTVGYAEFYLYSLLCTSVSHSANLKKGSKAVPLIRKALPPRS
jgi:hypothetical protein